MLVLRWVGAGCVALAAGLAAVGCWYAALVSDLGGDDGPGRPLWFAAAVAFLVLGVVVWSVVLPRTRLWGIAAVVASTALWFVVLGGLNT